MHQHTDVDAVRAQWAASPSLRTEFGGSFERYSAFHRAEQAGLVRVHGAGRVVRGSALPAAMKLRGQRFAFDAEITAGSTIRLSATAEGRISGVLVTYNTVNRRRLRLAAGVFAGTLGTPKPLLFRHQEIIGRWTEFADGPRQLSGIAELNRNTAAGLLAFEHLRAGDVACLSVGFNVADEPDAVEEDDAGVVTIRRGELLEASVVIAGADREARVGAVR